MTAPDEREYKTWQRGEIRDDVILATYRNALRSTINPATGVLFTEDQVLEATQPGSRFYIDADAIDIVGQTQQASDLEFADQIDPERANDAMADNHHGRLWLGENSRLPASRSSGDVRTKASPGAIYPGSLTIGDPTAAVATDPDGLKYQVSETRVTPANGVADLPMRSVDTGRATNIAPGTKLTWGVNAPLSTDPQAEVLPAPGSLVVGFSGGFDIETTAEYMRRVVRRMRYRGRSGNDAHMSEWSERASVAVERGFVYPTAQHAGSTMVAIVQKRDLTTLAGPLARIPTDGTLTDAIAYLVPPASPVVPDRVHVVVVKVVAQSSDIILRLNMNRGSEAGWFNAVPWPEPAKPSDPSTTEVVAVSAVTSQTLFDVSITQALPDNAAVLTGSDAPALMVWNDGTGRFERLQVSQLEDVGGNTIRVTLGAEPDKTIAVGDRISPYTDRLGVIGEALESYFDSLGPGEIVASTDARADRCIRFPETDEEYPALLTQQLMTEVVNALGGVASAGELTHATRTEPDLPVNVTDGPGMIVCGKVSLYPL